jgi:hypothetical protein
MAFNREGICLNLPIGPDPAIPKRHRAASPKARRPLKDKERKRTEGSVDGDRALPQHINRNTPNAAETDKHYSPAGIEKRLTRSAGRKA